MIHHICIYTSICGYNRLKTGTDIYIYICIYIYTCIYIYNDLVYRIIYVLKSNGNLGWKLLTCPLPVHWCGRNTSWFTNLKDWLSHFGTIPPSICHVQWRQCNVAITRQELATENWFDDHPVPHWNGQLGVDTPMASDTFLVNGHNYGKSQFLSSGNFT